jgi:ABC-type molybdate transport system substrate-binding protein
VAHEVPAKETPNISYPMAVVSETRQPEVVKRFLQHLNSTDAASVFARFGFIVRK